MLIAACLQAPVEAQAAPKQLHGFELVREQYVAEYDSQVLMYRHKKTGEAFLSMPITPWHDDACRLTPIIIWKFDILYDAV